MKYATSSAFRRALEDRLRTLSFKKGIPLSRLRKMVAFDRFLSRLFAYGPNQWVVKGGFALQLRIGEKARTTRDIDLLMLAGEREMSYHLRRASTLDQNDWFLFEISDGIRSEADDIVVLRYNAHALLDGRTFERFHIDIGVGDLLLESPEYLETPTLLSFAGIEPTLIPCYPISQQIAEKFHAFTRTHESGSSSRVKDLVDMLLLAEMEKFSSLKLQKSLRATFQTRSSQPMPLKVPSPPKNWNPSFRRMANEVGLSFKSLSSAESALQQFLNPILDPETNKTWNPEHWQWT
ncbi:MAG: nucleotidyl transferase AbiEii/AbiGii toxin family protein [Anaerolineaceae bacterium]|nr:nucleotidyl transferase AbiEii/AbiGii toxin family protein [Anaerolineaceae bacterium]